MVDEQIWVALSYESITGKKKKSNCLNNFHLKLAELQKASSTSSAELNFFEIFRQICPVFRQFLSLKVQIRNNLEIPSSQPLNDANYVNTL